MAMTVRRFILVTNIVVSICNTEILRASILAPNQNFVHERMEHGSPLRLAGHSTNGGPMDLEGWSAMQVEVVLLAVTLV